MTAPVRQPDELVVVSAAAVGSAGGALRFMLITHGLVAVGVGVLVATDTLTGRPFAVLSLLPGWPWTWGLALALAGAATCTGRTAGWLRLTRAGVQAQAIWYLLQGLGIAAAIPSGGARYPAVMYCGLALVLYAHLHWLTDHGDWRR